MKSIKSRLCGLVAALLCAVGVAAAQAYPSKPVGLMVPYPAGGVSDAIARVIGVPLTKELGQQVLVENVGGVSGAIAAQRVLSAPGDGYYLFQGSPNEVILSPLANASVKLRAEDFRLVQPVATATLVVMVRKDLPVNSIDELIELARKSGGKPLVYGSVGVGSLYHVMVEDMQRLTGTRMTHVPYKGGAPLVQDLAGGLVDFTILPYGAAFAAMAEQGRFKLLATASATRPDILKNLPTIAESKSLKGFVYTIWSGFLVRKDTPEPVVQRLHQAIGTVLKDPAVRSALALQMQFPAEQVSLEEASRFYASEIAHYRSVAKAVGLKPQ